MELLSARLRADRVQLWRQVERLLSEAAPGTPPAGAGGVTAEFYMSLVAKLIAELRREVPRDSRPVQTDPGPEDPALARLLEEAELRNAGLTEYLSKISNFPAWMLEEPELPGPCRPPAEAGTASGLKALKTMELWERQPSLDKLLDLADDGQDLMARIIATQHANLRTMKELRASLAPVKPCVCRFKPRDSEDSELRRELELVKAQNERLSIRVELYKAELSRVYGERASSNPSG